MQSLGRRWRRHLLPFLLLEHDPARHAFPLWRHLGRHLLSSIFYLLSSSIFCLLLSSDFFYLLISSIFCLLLSAQWLFVNELVGEIPAFYIHILLRVSSVAPPGLLRGLVRVLSGSHPGYSVAHPGIPWLIRGSSGVFRVSSGVFRASSWGTP